MAYVIDNSPAMDGANAVIGKMRATNAFLQNFHDPQWSQTYTEQFPQYSLVPLLDRLDRIEGISQEEWNWAELERTRENVNITNDGGNPVTTLTPANIVTVEADETTQYFIPNDVVELPTGRLAVVNSVALPGVTGGQILTLEEMDGSDLADADFLVDTKIIHRYNLHPGCSDAPEGRVWAPTAFSNKLAILRRTCKVCDDEYSNSSYLTAEDGSKYWYSTQQTLTRREFMIDREQLIMFGQSGTQTSTGAVSGFGIYPSVETSGVVGTYATSVAETDIQDHIEQLKIYSPGEEFLVLAGVRFMKDATIALAPYHLDGALSYGVFGASGGTFGLNVQQYRFNDTLVTFVHYPLFTDPKLNGGSTDYKKVGLFLNMGNDAGGHPLISLKTKKNPNGGDYRFNQDYKPGLASVFGDEGPSASLEACWSESLYAHLGLELRALNNHGLLKPA